MTRALIAAVAAVAITLSLAAGTARAEDEALPRICSDGQRNAGLMYPDLSRYPQDGVVILGKRDFPLRSSPAVWRMWDSRDPVFSTRFHSMMWLVPGVHSGLPVVDLVL